MMGSERVRGGWACPGEGVKGEGQRIPQLGLALRSLGHPLLRGDWAVLPQPWPAKQGDCSPRPLEHRLRTAGGPLGLPASRWAAGLGVAGRSLDGRWTVESAREVRAAASGCSAFSTTTTTHRGPRPPPPRPPISHPPSARHLSSALALTHDSRLSAARRPPRPLEPPQTTLILPGRIPSRPALPLPALARWLPPIETKHIAAIFHPRSRPPACSQTQTPPAEPPGAVLFQKLSASPVCCLLVAHPATNVLTQRDPS